MLILAIDTSTTLAQISLFDTDTLSPMYALSWQSVRAQTRELAGAIQQAWEHCSQTAADMDLIAVCTGPGSYAGVRIGLSVAKGLATGSSRPLPLMGLPAMSPLLRRLWVLARNSGRQTDLTVAQAAGRGYYNWASLDGQGPWRYLETQDFHWGTGQDFEKFLLDLNPAADREVWVGGIFSKPLPAAMASKPGLRFLGDFDQPFSATQLAHLAWHRWQTDADWKLPRSLVPIYPQDL